MTAGPVAPESRRGSRLALVAYEGWANVRGWAAAGLILATLAAVIGGTIGWTSVRSADSAISAIAQLELQGRHVLRVRTVGGLDAAQCDRLQDVSAVRSAFGFLGSTSATTNLGAVVTVQTATPGIATFVGLAPAELAESPSVLAGASLATRFGVVSGGTLRFSSSAPGALRDRSVTTYTLPRGPRTTTLDDSLIAIAPPIGQLTDCIVDVDPANAAALARALPALLPRDAEPSIAPYNPEIEGIDEPDRNLRAIPGNVITLGGAGLVIITLLGWWFARRTEWALYRVFGIGGGTVSMIAGLEWMLVIGLPLLVGGAWGIILAGLGSPQVAITLAAMNVGAAAAASALAVAVWSAYAASSSVARALRGL